MHLPVMNGLGVHPYLGEDGQPRLKRNGSTDADYAVAVEYARRYREEIVAELGGAFVRAGVWYAGAEWVEVVEALEEAATW